MPTAPTRPVKLKHRPGIAADFSEVSFETYIVVDNLYQGYLTTQSDDLLDELSSVLYPGIKTPLAPWERIAVFYWTVSLKDFFSRKFPDLLQPVATSSDGNLLGSSAPSVEEAMNAQIRALTKGDVTKEQEILALDTWRALTELNAQAKEWPGLKSIVRIESRTKDIKKGAVLKEIRYYLSSLEADAQYINHSIRTHWSVENQLHWTLDVAFGDDASRKQKENAAQNFSLLNRIGLNIIKNAKVSSMGIKGHRKKAGWDNDYLLYALKSFDVIKN